MKGLNYLKGYIADVHDGYKYFGIPQSNGIHDEAARKSATTKYTVYKERLVLKNQLHGKNDVQDINMYTVPVVNIPH